MVHGLIGEVGSYTFVEMDGSCMQLSGIKEFYNDAYLREYEHGKNQGAVVSESTVRMWPLDDIFRKDHIDTVTYISAECEGCEFSFIKSFNFTAFDGQRSITLQYRQEIDEILKGHGFELVFEAGDRLFVRHSTGL